MNRLDLKSLAQLRSAPPPQQTTAEILVSLGTCGAAAGGERLYEILRAELERSGLRETVFLKKTGCLGDCCDEPNLVVRMKGLPDTVYGPVDENLAKRIIEEHIVGRTPIDGHAMTLPAKDILKETDR